MNNDNGPRNEAPETELTKSEARMERYRQFEKAHPGTTYAQWLHANAVRAVKSGSEHATLGGNLRKFDNWWDAGDATFKRHLKLFPISEDSKVVDYGCGSLRVGGHYIRYLKPKRYFGLDVTTDLITVGKDLVGETLISEKKPEFGPIDEKTIKRAARFKPDFVISTAVCYHVHPAETPTYFGNLTKLAHRKGTVLFFDASISSVPSTEHALAKPLDFYVAALPDFSFVEFHCSSKRENGEGVGILEFVRK